MFYDGNEEDASDFGGSSSFTKKGITKDQETGEIIGWEEFFNQINASMGDQMSHDSRVDADTLNQINP